ncbi:MAG: penicillin-binding protein 2 [Patescibacteria group bacterium]|jgi:cell division protein FtsI/penicillin-binding protein 2
MAIIKRQKSEPIQSLYQKRITLLALIIFFISFVIIGRLFVLQIWDHSFYHDLAERRQEVLKNLLPLRGSIYTKEKDQLFPLVTNRDYYLVYAEPVKIKDAKKVIDAITPILGLKEEEWQPLLAKLSKGSDPYEPIKHKVAKPEMEKIQALKIEGIGILPESYRFYPEKGIGGQLFGFVGFKGDEKIGQYGLEGYFNQPLTGKSGEIKSIKDALGSLITIGPRSIKKAENGVDLVLTIDRTVQFIACQKLKFYYDYFRAESGTVIIMKPSGEILAMCNYPDYDAENYGEVGNIDYFNNPAIFAAYEPGSVFKMVTMAAGLDSGKVTPESTYIDTGEVKIDSFTIRNSDLKAHGQQTMIQVLENSLNTGVIFVEQLIGKETFQKYVKAFGFGQPTGITLDKEMPGDISPLDKPGRIYGMTSAFGQGITVTPLQLTAAFGAIANKGTLVKPYLVSEIIHPDGKKEEFGPQTVRQVVDPKTATLLTGMLTSVVERGYGKKAGVKGYYFAGKTGTAQVPAPGGGYGGKTIHTFVGFGPVSNPQFVMLVKLNNPSGPRFAEDTICPLFHDIAAYLLNYYQIPPDY